DAFAGRLRHPYGRTDGPPSGKAGAAPSGRAGCGRVVAELAHLQRFSRGRIGSRGRRVRPPPGGGSGAGRAFRPGPNGAAADWTGSRDVSHGSAERTPKGADMATHEVTFPVTDEREILKLRAGDEVIVQGHIIGIRDRTQIRIFDQGVEPPMDLRGAFLLHTAPGVRKLDDGRYEKVCIGTTTSARMVRFTEPLGAQYGVRAICGKGGFPDEAIEPMQKLGMVYFAIVGGAAALETTQIEEIEEVAWEELMPECLWKFRVKDFGPLTVGIDAHGNSLYHDVQSAAQEKLKELYARL